MVVQVCNPCALGGFGREAASLNLDQAISQDPVSKNKRAGELVQSNGHGFNPQEGRKEREKLYLIIVRIGRLSYFTVRKTNLGRLSNFCRLHKTKRLGLESVTHGHGALCHHRSFSSLKEVSRMDFKTLKISTSMNGSNTVHCELS